MERGTQFANLEGILREPERIKQDPIGFFLEQMGTVSEMANVGVGTIDISYLSPEQRAETLWALFQDVRRLVSRLKSRKKTVDVHKMQERFGALKQLYEDQETRAAYLGANEKHVQEIKNSKGNYEKYQALHTQITTAQDTFDASARILFTHRAVGADEMEKLIFETTKKHLLTLRKSLADLIASNPDLAAYIQYKELKRGADQFRRDRFDWTETRRKLLEKIVEHTISGKPILLFGESGTGKTSLVKHLAWLLTGKPPAKLGGKDIRLENLLVHRRIHKKGDFYEYKDLGRAITGKLSTQEESPSSQGEIVLDDEANLRDRDDFKELMAFVADLSPGEEITMPITGKRERVAENFAYIGAMNLASSKYVGKDVPVEVLRKCVKEEVPFLEQSADNPEIYETMLKALMDRNGRIRVPKSIIAPEYIFKEETREIERKNEDGTTTKSKATIHKRELLTQKKVIDPTTNSERTVAAGGFLWRFAEAIHQLNNAISDKDTVLKHKGEGQKLTKIIIDIGMIHGWLKKYTTIARTKNLELFMLQQLRQEFIDNKSYPSEDRNLAKEFFAYFDIDVNKTEVKEEEQQFGILTDIDIGLLSPRVKYEKVLTEEPEVAESYVINEDGERIDYFIKPYQEGKMTYTPGMVLEGQGGKIYEFRGVTKATGEPVLSPYKRNKAEPKEKGPKPAEGAVTIEKAREIMESEFLGPEEVEKTFGIRLEAKDIPPIPFTEMELQRAKKLGQFLVLRVGIAPDKNPLTMKKMKELLEKSFGQSGIGKVLFETDWYKNEDFYKTDAQAVQWALTSKEILSGSTDKNYLEQTEQLVEYVKDQVFGGGELPVEYQEAIAEYEQYYKNNFKGKSDVVILELLMGRDWKKYADELGDLKINQLTRQNPDEVLYDLLVYFQNKGRLLENCFTWTKRRDSVGYLVYVGKSDADGAYVGAYKSYRSDENLGVVFSRSR